MTTLAVVLALLLGGCSMFLPRSGDDRARDAARATARQIAADIDDSRPRNVLASDLAYLHSDASRVAPATDDAAASGEGDHLRITALSWDGMTRDDDGARFVLEIAVHQASFTSGSFGGESVEAGDWTGCFAFRVRPFFAWTPTTADETRCPEGDGSSPTPPPSPAPVPSLPDGAQETLRSVLAGATAGSLAAELAAAFPDGSVRSDPVTGARLIRDSGSEGAVLAAAVGIAGTTDCAVGTRAADGTVQVWHPQAITLSAGEAGCTISNALHPVTTH
ncbi:hypothetical protein VD659_16580 [Herbiconiux sp. 11R-BC]|uniref:hypothetical protein n=1 Tax=Herbiconiux sp. 11R-BC TaxID=3111637 RepID=UPI003C0CB812